MSDKSRPAALAFWPLATLLLSVSVSLICWRIYNAMPQMARAEEKPLRLASISPKFNHTSADVPRVQIPELLPVPKRSVVANATGEPAHFGLLTMEQPPAGPPAVDLPLTFVPPPLPPLDFQPNQLTIPALPVVAVQAVDTNPLVYRDSNPGDTPMLRNWKTLALYSLLTSTVFVQVPAPALADEEAKTEKITLEGIKKSLDDVAKDTKEIKADLLLQKGDLKTIKDDIGKLKEDGVQHKLDMAKTKTRIAELETTLEKYRSELELMKKAQPIASNMGIDKDSVTEIKTKLGGIEKAIMNLQPSVGRVAFSPPTAPSTGKIVLINGYADELLFVINQKPYSVPPGANRPIENIPAGVFEYEVFWNGASRARSTRNLAPNETFTLSAR